MNTKMPTTFGIEFSFVPSKDRPDALNNAIDGGDEALIEQLKADAILSPDDAASMMKALRGVEHAHNDGGCLEVPSPVFRSLKQTKNFWEKIRDQAKDMEYVPRRIDRSMKGDVYYGTGGGHIHVGILNKDRARYNRQDALLVKNLMTFVANNPWLGWVFNEFMDDINANALAGNKYMLNELSKKIPTKRKNHNCNKHKDYYGDCQICESDESERSVAGYTQRLLNLPNKDYAINFSDGHNGNWITAEFRFFDAPRSWHQTEEHVRFAMGIFSLCKKMAEKGRHIKLEATDRKYIDKFKSKTAVEREFSKTVKRFGLKWSKYAKYMQNYIDRESSGRLV